MALNSPPAVVSYRTTEIELAAYLKACGHKLTSAKPEGRFVTFEFDAAAADDADRYFAGAEAPARELFESHRSLRVLVTQLNEHRASQSHNRIERNNHNEYRSSPARR